MEICGDKLMKRENKYDMLRVVTEEELAVAAGR